jgi:hypothetical protein
MDIPRGTFSTIRRDTAISTVLAEIRDTSFSGYAMVSLGDGPISLVFSEGACILAESGDRRGAAAWQAVRSMGQTEVDIGLYLLTPQQIQLADEFNRDARVSHSETPARQEGAQEVRSTARVRPSKASPEREHLVVPRGEFCEMKKAVPTAKILERLKERAFTGYGQFTVNSVNFTLVFSGGTCILAGYGEERGDAALERAKALGAPGDVGLYTLTPQQIALSLEFNGGYRVESPPRPEARSMAERPLRSPKAAEAPATIRRSPPPPKAGVAGPGIPPAAPVREKSKGAASAASPATDAIMRELEALDAIDAAEMTVNLKTSYVSILDRLQLGHLVDEKKEKEA